MQTTNDNHVLCDICHICPPFYVLSIKRDSARLIEAMNSLINELCYDWQFNQNVYLHHFKLPPVTLSGSSIDTVSKTVID